MNKAQMIEAVAEKLQTSKANAREIVESVMGVVAQGVKENGEAVLPGLGKLKVVDAPERSGTSFGVAWTKPASKKIKFSISAEGRELV